MEDAADRGTVHGPGSYQDPEQAARRLQAKPTTTNLEGGYTYCSNISFVRIRLWLKLAGAGLTLIASINHLRDASSGQHLLEDRLQGIKPLVGGVQGVGDEP